VGLDRCSLAVQGQVGKLSCPTFFVVVYVCKRSEVITIVDIVCYDQVRLGQVAARGHGCRRCCLASPCLAARALLSGGKISAGVSLRTPSLSEWPGLGLS